MSNKRKPKTDNSGIDPDAIFTVVQPDTGNRLMISYEPKPGGGTVFFAMGRSDDPNPVIITLDATEAETVAAWLSNAAHQCQGD